MIIIVLILRLISGLVTNSVNKDNCMKTSHSGFSISVFFAEKKSNNSILYFLKDTLFFLIPTKGRKRRSFLNLQHNFHS